MKVLGFTFSNQPTVNVHVEDICKKFRQTFWALRHLKKIGFNESELVRTYLCSIVPIADYCCVVNHSLLPDELDEALENVQVGALRSILVPAKRAKLGYEESGAVPRAICKV